MNNAIIIVGIDGFAQFTAPAIGSIRNHDEETPIILVDAGSKEPYPDFEKGDIQTLRLDKSPSYSYAINWGIRYAEERDWYLILNNDILAKGRIPFEKLDPGLIHTRQVVTEDGHTWMGLWIAALSRQVIERVGEFDENFLVCGFEDADYCIRAKGLGIDTVHYPFPVNHLWGKTRWGIPQYRDIREDNMNYFAKKHGFRLGTNMKVIYD